MLAEVALRRIQSLAAHLSSDVLALAAPATAAIDMVGHQTAAMSTKRRRFEDPDDVYIVGVARTPLGAFQGSLSHLSATDLGGIAIKAALDRAGVPLDAVGEVFMGNVCSAGLGQAPARQAALKAGLPLGVDATAVNKVCSSGMKAVALGAQSVALGAHAVVVAGGMESMSNIPFYSNDHRKGSRLGHSTLIDGLIHDGLWDSSNDMHMGHCAERCAERHGIGRAAQDEHALRSVERAKRAAADGSMGWEVVPVAGRSGAAVTEDEAVAKMDPEKLRRLKPYFKAEGGTVTAGNASPITDGAAAVVLASASAVRRLGLPVLGRILGYADAAADPLDFPTAPALAIPRALARAGISQQDVDLWEINEAFSVVDLVNQKLLGLDSEKVNVFGGAVAIGHPIGASGARMICTLLNALRVQDGRVGVAAVCNGGGGATAMVLERVTAVDGEQNGGAGDS